MSDSQKISRSLSLVKRFEPRPGLLRHGTSEHRLRRRRLIVLEREGWATNKPLGFAKARPARTSGPLLQAMAGTFAVVGGICLHQGACR